MLETRSWDGWRRLSASVLDQVADDDPAALAQLLEHLSWIESRLPDVVARLRTPDPQAPAGTKSAHSWAEIGAALGISKQGAQRRFSRAGR